jgi:carbonic anhydrase
MKFLLASNILLFISISLIMNTNLYCKVHHQKNSIKSNSHHSYNKISSKHSNSKTSNKNKNSKKPCIKKTKSMSNLLSNYLPENEVTILTKKVSQPVILVPISQPTCNEHWDYSKHGDNWECQCKEGKQQSPIDLPKAEDAKSSSVKPLFLFEEVIPDEKFKILNENQILKIYHYNFGKVVTLDGTKYLGHEINFHTPSEHKIDGKRFDMEMQVIFSNILDLAEEEKPHTGNKHIVLSFLFYKDPGAYNQFFESLDIFNLPDTKTKSRSIENKLYIPKIFYGCDSDEMPAMKPFSFYTYSGSLTTPPCTEKTIHYVASDPIPLANVIVEQFSKVVRKQDENEMDCHGNINFNLNVNSGKGFENYRNIKEMNERNVYFYKYDLSDD